MTDEGKPQPKVASPIKQVTRAGGMCWAYDTWIPQPDGTRRRFRDSGFATKAEAKEALAALTLKGRKTRYGLAQPDPIKHTTIGDAISTLR